jgi:hypothetical protein
MWRFEFGVQIWVHMDRIQDLDEVIGVGVSLVLTNRRYYGQALIPSNTCITLPIKERRMHREPSVRRSPDLIRDAINQSPHPRDEEKT